MTQRILFRVFLICLICCASMFLASIWFKDAIGSPVYFQIAASFFIVGLASFLIWFSCTLLSIRNQLQK